MTDGSFRGLSRIRTAAGIRLHAAGAVLVAALLLVAGVGSPAARASGAATLGRQGSTEAVQGVLLITIDTLRRDMVGCYGGPAATPNIDALAARGVRFDDAFAHAVLTLVSHTSILAGLDPSRHGVHDNVGFRASDKLHTWAERFHEAGYATAAFVGAFPLDSQFGLAQGFDLYDDYYGNQSASPFRMVQRPADKVVGPARRWIRRQRGKWFAWVHVYDPHAPYSAPEPFKGRHPDAPYLDEIEFTDSALGPLLKDAQRKKALVVLTADHGESLGEHGEDTHGVFAYASTLAVPLVIAGAPGAREGAVVSDRVGHEDLLPTALELASLPTDGVEGSSLVGLLRGTGTLPERALYFESLSPNLSRNWAPLRGVYQGEWKFIDLPVPELYRVSTDPRELNNLADSEPATLARLQKLLDQHLSGAGGAEVRVTEDPATLRRLRALGYVGSGSGGRDKEYGPEDDPKNLMALDHRVQDAVVEAEQGNLDAAVGLLNEVLAQRPDFVDALTVWATIENGRGHGEAVIERLSAAAKEPWATARLRTKLGLYLVEAGRLADAGKVEQEVLEQEPDNFDALILLATIRDRQGQGEQAEALLDHALQVDPTAVRAYVNRGTLRLGHQRFEDAEADFREAIRYDPRSSEAHNGLGVAYWKMNRAEQAIEEWRTAISLNEKNFDALENLGINLVRLNRFAEAVKVLDQLTSSVPESLWARYQVPQIRDMVAKIKRDQGIR